VISSDVESLKQGIIKTSKNEGRAPYTILLVGETGVGKSSVLELIANVLIGNAGHYDFDILDHTNEQGGSDNQSQTNSARLYEITSKNGIMVSPSVSVE
jgi:predicted GTPase